MPTLQRILRKSFAWSAVIFSAAFFALAPALIRSPLPHATARFHAGPVGMLLVTMRELLLLMPAVVAVSCAMAWWTLQKGAPAARRWSIAASASLFVLSIPFFVADVTILQSYAGRTYQVAGVLTIAVALFSLGLMGFAAFRNRNPLYATADARVPMNTSGKEIDALAPTL